MASYHKEMKSLTFIRPLCFFILTALFTHELFAQSLRGTLGGRGGQRTTQFGTTELVPERIDRISESRRIFIITNQRQSFSKGDYITLVLGSDVVARALVARTTPDNLAGIKILKIYSLTQWNRLREGLEVQIIRGDDSAFIAAQREEQQEEDRGIITSSRDLFDQTTFLEDDIIFDDRSNRILTQDNIISLYLGLVEGIDTDGSMQRYRQLNGSWSHQIQDNIWIDAAYGRTVINEFPSSDISTTFTNMSLKVKYVFPAPMFSYFKPYVGYQVLSASSPQAGEDPDGTRSSDDLNAELARLDELKKNDLIFGVTFLKRLVPGWFFRADLGTDMIAGGFALEF